MADTERIAAAAVDHDGRIWSVPPPGRHPDVIRLIANERPASLPVRGGAAQGFITSSGRFVGREEAGRIALAAGQSRTLRPGVRLFSEDLW